MLTMVKTRRIQQSLERVGAVLMFLAARRSQFDRLRRNTTSYHTYHSPKASPWLTMLFILSFQV